MVKLIKAKNDSNGLIVLLIMTMALFVGCGSGSFGKYKLSDEVRNTFMSFQVLPDHNYYYSGSSSKPDGILAVRKSYTLTSADLWIEANPDSKQLKYWVEEMHKRISRPPYGYNILTSDGKKIGVIYTPWDKGLLKMEGENQVSIGLPSRDADQMKAPRLFK